MLRTAVRAPLLACALAGVLSAAACASMDAPSGRDATAPATAANEANEANEATIRKVADGLFAAGQPTRSQWPSIRERGVVTVINLRPDREMAGRDEAAEVASAGMAYRQLGVAGIHDITDANAARLREWIDESPGPVLVHCASGNRAGALLAVIAARSGTPLEEALELGRRAGLTSLEEPVRALLAPAVEGPR